MSTVLWRLTAVLAAAFGFIGVVIPGLPTVPFLLLAAWCAAKGWPALEQWLLTHPRYGETIQHWQARKAVPRRAKLAATVMMLVSVVVIGLLDTPLALRIFLPAVLFIVALWLWRRPEH
ncbi:MAG: YbaN family protein [Parahaliea sp.]